MVGFPITSNPTGLLLNRLGIDLCETRLTFFSSLLAYDFKDWSFLLSKLSHHHVSLVLHYLEISIPVYYISCTLFYSFLRRHWTTVLVETLLQVLSICLSEKYSLKKNATVIYA